MYKHILIPTDGSERSNRAILAGIQLAKELNAKVTGLFVSESSYVPAVDSGLKPLAEAALAHFSERAEEAGVTSFCVSVVGDSPQDAIVHLAAERGCDLIVMGTHGRSRVGKFFLGSVAASVLSNAEVPVLLYR